MPGAAPKSELFDSPPAVSHIIGSGVVEADFWACPKSHQGPLSIVVMDLNSENVLPGPRSIERIVQIEGVMQHENDDA